MPRVAPTLLKHAAREDRVLASLLPICRDVTSARNELRWLRQHALQRGIRPNQASRRLNDYVKRRASGEPLQYILGTEFFGELELFCRRGVLIPRLETAAAVSHLASLIRSSTGQGAFPRTTRVLDLCTGSGCIPLLFQHEFYREKANVDKELALVGVDISLEALALAEKNRSVQTDHLRARGNGSPAQIRALADMRFVRADVLYGNHPGAFKKVLSVKDALNGLQKSWQSTDILISNPPYISQYAFRTSTARSVRLYEPKLALVPPKSISQHIQYDGDLFYPHLLTLAELLAARLLLLEVADMDQAVRVATMCAQRGSWQGIQIWRDEPGRPTVRSESVECHGVTVRVCGSGHGRSVVAYREDVAGLFPHSFERLHSSEERQT